MALELTRAGGKAGGGPGTVSITLQGCRGCTIATGGGTGKADAALALVPNEAATIDAVAAASSTRRRAGKVNGRAPLNNERLPLHTARA